jgi:broad specificity phosphatase PhoE
MQLGHHHATVRAMTTIFLIRHGDTDYVGRAIAGWTAGVHLNRVGVTQAQFLPQRFQKMKLAAVYSSPLERAMETAAPLASAQSLQIVPHEALGEIRFGEWTGLTLADLDLREDWRRFNSFRSVQRAPGGESMIEVQARIVAELTALAERHGDQAIAAFSHGDVVRAALAHYLAIPLDLMQRFEIGPGSISILRLSVDCAQVLRLNDTGEIVA